MARVTVEDCILKVPNRFDLVMLAAQRARSVLAGAALTVERDNDKNPVVALREIADETIDLENLEDNLIKSLQKYVEIEEPEEDDMDMAAIQQGLGGTADAEGTQAPDEAALEDQAEKDDAVDGAEADEGEDAADEAAAPEKD